MSQRRTSSLVADSSRRSSRVRRAPMAAASTPTRTPDARIVARLVEHLVARAGGDSEAGRRLSAYTYELRRRGLGEVVSTVVAATTTDGGRLLRQIATETSSDPSARGEVLGAVVGALVVAVEHRVEARASLVLLLRSALQGHVLDRALTRLACGQGRPGDEALVARLDGPARLNFATALQVARESVEAMGPRPDPQAERLMRQVIERRKRIEAGTWVEPGETTTTETAAGNAEESDAGRSTD